MKLNRIKEVLIEQKRSQLWLAKELGKSLGMINNYACNRIQPTLDVLYRISEILDVDLKTLITNKKEREQA